MRVCITDKAEIEGVQRTSEGYLMAYAKIARTGVYDYAGFELGKPDVAKISVLRPADEVFAVDAIASIARKPVTNDHPAEEVTARNWKKLAVGTTDAEALRDGEFLRIPFTVTDAAAIAAYDAGKVELSPGYRTEITFEDGDHEGVPYQAVARNIRYNHLAIVDKARGGSHCRIGDSFTPIQQPGDPDMNTKTILVDGLQVVVTDAAEAAITKLQGQLADAKASITTLETAAGANTVAIADKDKTIADLTTKLADATVTPEKLATLVAARTAIVADAKKVGGADIVTDGKTDIEIQRAALTAKLGDAAVTAMSDEAIAGAFAYAVSTADGGSNDFRRDLLDTRPVADKAAEAKAFNDSVADLNAWRTAAK